MFINNPSTGSTPAQLWAAATRTLTADPFTNAGGGAIVWNSAGNTVRGLTTASGWISGQSLALTSIAASTTVDLRAPANYMRDGTFAVDNALVHIEMYDGTNAISMNGVTGQLAMTAWGSSSVGVRLNNTDGASAHNYMYAFLKSLLT